MVRSLISLVLICLMSCASPQYVEVDKSQHEWRQHLTRSINLSGGGTISASYFDGNEIKTSEANSGYFEDNKLILLESGRYLIDILYKIKTPGNNLDSVYWTGYAKGSLATLIIGGIAIATVNSNGPNGMAGIGTVVGVILIGGAAILGGLSIVGPITGSVEKSRSYITYSLNNERELKENFGTLIHQINSEGKFKNISYSKNPTKGNFLFKEKENISDAVTQVYFAESESIFKFQTADSVYYRLMNNLDVKNLQFYIAKSEMLNFIESGRKESGKYLDGFKHQFVNNLKDVSFIRDIEYLKKDTKELDFFANENKSQYVVILNLEGTKYKRIYELSKEDFEKMSKK